MPKVRISGVEGLEGEYDVLIHFLNARYTTAEWRAIKQKTGLLPADFLEHSDRQDPDVFAAALWVTLTREGKDSKYVWTALDNSDLFDDDKFAAVEEDEPEEVEPELPPVQTPPSTDDGNDNDTSDDAESESQSSPPPLALLENPPSPTGFPRSATGAA